MFVELPPLKKPETAPNTPPRPSLPLSVKLPAVVGRLPSPPLLLPGPEAVDDILSGLGGRTIGTGGVEAPPAAAAPEPTVDHDGDLGARFQLSAEKEGSEPRL